MTGEGLKGEINLNKRKKRTGARVLQWLGMGVLAWILLSLLVVVPLRWLPVRNSSFMIQSRISNDAPPAQNWVNYEDISEHMALAVVVGEDRYFAEHRGFDMQEIRGAIEDYRAGEALRGASTISQQTAKNLYLWPGRSIFRKLLEAWFTVLIEFSWPKERILEVYLNVAQFGDNLFGVEAASREFFDKTAAELDFNEAALLAAVLPAPEKYRVDEPSDYLHSRRDWIIHHMIHLQESP